MGQSLPPTPERCSTVNREAFATGDVRQQPLLSLLSPHIPGESALGATRYIIQANARLLAE